MKKIADIFYPRRCFGCQEILEREGEYLCASCRKKLKLISGPVCMKCGKSLRREEEELCMDCRRQVHRFSQGAAAFPYGGAMRRSIQRMKFQNRRDYLDGYAWYMARQARPRLPVWRPELVCPIPLHPAKRRRRGFDQSRLLAQKLGDFLELPVDTEALVRVRNTRPQKLLPGSERRKNMRGAFACAAEKADCIRGKRIVLVDDVYTTGATADSAAGALLDAGADRVFLLLVCIGSENS